METFVERQRIQGIEHVTTSGGLDDLRPEWAELWARCPSATPFQSPDWLLPWWRHLGRGELWVLAFRQDGSLRALAPFFRDEETSGSTRRVQFLGTGLSDYLDLLVEPGFEKSCAARFLSILLSQSDRWDCCDFHQLPAHSPLLDLDIPPELMSEVTVQEVCPVLKLSGIRNGCPAEVSPHMLGKLKYYRRRAQKSGPVHVEAARPENFSDLFKAFLDLHQARWAARGQTAALADERVKAFHQEVAETMLGTGVLRLYGLRLRDQWVASFYGFSHARRVCYYLGGFNPQQASFSPGTLLVGHAIEAAAAEGATDFDFLRGREPYKYLWGAKDHLNHRRTLKWAAGRRPPEHGGTIPD